MEDITFYDFEFNPIYILPPFHENGGYISINCDKDFNDTGTAEIMFYDVELADLIRKSPLSILFKWGDFWGFMTSYEFKSAQQRIMGMHINGLLHKIAVAPIKSTRDTTVNIAANALKNVTWLTVFPVKRYETVSYSTDTYRTADEVIQEIAALEKGGYILHPDKANRKFILHLLKPKNNGLLLSEGMRNAYNFTEDYNGKEYATSGYYKDSDGKWHNITATKKNGIYETVCILSADNEEDAKKELAEKNAVKSVTAEIKSAQYGVDYDVGDIVKIEHNGIVKAKIIKSVNIYQDSGYGAMPTFEDWEE